MKRASLFLALLVVITLVCGSALGQQKAAAPADTRAADEKAIREADAAQLKAVAAKDIEKCIGVYADNATVFEPGKPAYSGKAAIRATFREGFATPGFALSWQLTKVEVARSGDLAYSMYTYTMAANDASGKPVKSKGKGAGIWKKMADGGWKMIVDIYNEDGPAVQQAPPPPPPKKR
jgi:uncharacterized protein (TIGR02246 family)